MAWRLSLTESPKSVHDDLMEQHTDKRNKWGSAIAPLFVPGDRPDRIHKAAARGARHVVIDLEDAVADGEKPRARQSAVEALSDRWPGAEYMVRVNAVDSGSILVEDLRALEPVLRYVDGLILPKITCADDVREIEGLLAGLSDVAPVLVPTIETTEGVYHARDIARSSRSVATLLFGPVDLAAQLGIDLSAEAPGLVHARSAVVLACADAGLVSPLDGPWTNLDDAGGLERSSAHARSLGFGGKIGIHPAQVGTIETFFVPTNAQTIWAKDVLAQFDSAVGAGSGVARLPDGTFIDQPVATRARRILELAGRTRA